MAGTPSASNGGGHHHAPMVLLDPAHLQFYGVDATLSNFNQPPKTAASTDPVPPASAENPLPTTPAEAPPPAARNADVPMETHGGSAQSSGSGPSGARNVPERQQQQQQLQQKRQQRPGFSVGSSARREKLPSAPPAMSGRCQVHPALMKDLGASPGDPVLVFALAEGWLSDAKPPPPRLLLAPAESGGDGAGVTAASAASNPRHAGQGPGVDVEALAVWDRHGGDGGGSGCGGGGIVVEGERGSVAVSGGGVSSGNEASSGDGVGCRAENAAFESCSYGAEGSVAGALVEQKAQKQQQQQQMLPVSQYQGGAVLSENAELRCLLCTVWTNPYLAPTQAAVDGRVNVPLTDSDYPRGPIRPSPEGTAAGVPAGRFGDLPGENAGSTREEAVNSSVEDSIASYFLRAAVSRQSATPAASLAASGERAKRGSAVVGIITLHSTYGELAAAMASAVAAGRGGRAAGFCGPPPLASRISARVLRPATRALRKETGFGGTTARGASARTSALPPGAAAGPVSADDRSSASATTAIGQETSGRRENPPTIPMSTEFLARRGNETEDRERKGAGAEGEERGGSLGTEAWRAPPFRPLPLPPEYTSLVKRSLRHLVVSCGCEVAVPACPDSGVDEAAGVSGPSDANGGRVRGGGGGRRRPADGTALLRIGPFSTAGGGGGGEMSHFGGVYLDGQSGSGAASATGALLAPFHLELSPSRPGMAGGAGGGGGGVRRTGPLAALLRGEVCAVGPDSIVLVEAEGDAGAPDAGGLPGLRGVWTTGVGSGVGDSGAGGDGGGGGVGRRAGVDQKAAAVGEPKHVGRRRERGDAKKVSMSPTDALVELMLLPMTAVKPAREGSTPLEFLVPRGVLLTGPPGVGKTFAVRSAVETVRELSSERGETLFQVQLTTLNGAEILSLGQWEACEALREAFSAAENWSRDSARGRRRGFPNAIGRRCAVIFLDEADALLARRDRDGDKAGGGDGARALAQLLTLMDGFHKAEGSHVLVFGATNRPGDLDPALRRPGRFDRELALPPPDLQARADILRHHLKGVKVVGGEGVINAVASKCVGYVGADLAALARQAVLLAARKQGVLLAQSRNTSEAFCPPRGAAVRAEEGGPVVGADVLAAAMEKVGASSLRGHHVTVPDTPWSDIGGMEEAKAKLRQAVEWPVANKEAFDRMGLTPPRGILLFGPPGCSKTTLVRAAATAAGATFVCLSGADVFSPYLGEAEAAVRQAFVLARNAAPALLFFDEIDAIVCKREGGGGKGSSNSAESRVLATFLTEMDGVGSLRGDNVIVVGATNRPEAVDRALLRPGRFDQVVYAPLPAEDARRQIFEVHTRRMTMDRENVDFRKLAKVSEGLTGAEIEGVCREAAMSSIREAGFGGEGVSGASGPGGLGGSKQATVTMRNLLAAATVSAARPGVTKEMIKGYDRFASGL